MFPVERKYSIITYLSKFAIISLFIAVLSGSCVKEYNLPVGLLPKSDLINLSVDSSFSIQTYTLYDDSVPSNAPTTALLGAINDPAIGTTKTEFITQFSATTNNILVMSNPLKPDSVCLYLAYQKDTASNVFAGTAGTPLHIRIYQLNAYITDTVNHYTKEDPSRYYDPEMPPLLDTIFKPYAQNDTMLVLKLSSFLASQFTGPSNLTSLTDVTLFPQFFKGLYCQTVADPNNKSIVGFNLLSANTKLVVYYRNDTAKVSIPMTFSITSSNAYFNLATHQYNSNINNAINNTTTPSTQYTYAQTNGGLKTLVKIPNLINWNITHPNNAIIKVELLVPILENNPLYRSPDGMMIETAKSDGIHSQYMFEYYTSTGGYLGVARDTAYTKLNYSFDISKYARDIVKNPSTDYGLYIYAENRSTCVRRAIIKNWLQPGGMKLYITYYVPPTSVKNK